MNQLFKTLCITNMCISQIMDSDKYNIRAMKIMKHQRVGYGNSVS
jgi:hypothetical protein